jgi:hypothetical protein
MPRWKRLGRLDLREDIGEGRTMRVEVGAGVTLDGIIDLSQVSLDAFPRRNF